jgi:uncharacterized cupredoxin-like copper-binding protein
MNKFKWLSNILIVCILALALSACGGSGPSVNVSMTSFKIALTPSSIAAGSITFHIKNDAPDVQHDVLVAKTDLAAGSLPTDSTGAVDVSKLTIVGQIQPVAAGASQDLTINNMTSGHYVFFCNVAGHYASGMYADFTVN